MLTNFYRLLVAVVMTVMLSSTMAAEQAPASYLIESFDIRTLPTYPDNGLEREDIQEALDRSLELLPERLTFDELLTVADDLGRLYQKHGYKFHSVYIPKQKIKGKRRVRLAALEAHLGDVSVRGDDDALNETILDLFSDFVGQPLYQPSIDKVVLGLKSKYGIDVFPYYSRGSKKGEVRLNVKADREARWVGSLTADNFGNESTGEDRVSVAVTGYDLFGDFDALTVGALTTVDSGDNTYGFITYETPVYSLDHTVSLSVSNNRFDVGGDFEALGLDADARLVGLQYSYTLSHSFNLLQKLGIRADYKQSAYDSLFNQATLEQEEISRSGTLFWALNYRPVTSAWSYGAYLGLSGGELEVQGADEATEYYKGTLNQQVQFGLGDIDSWWFSSFKWVVKGQYAEDKLSSFELLPISGAYGVRNVRAGYYGADRGSLTHVEWWLPSLFPKFWNVQIAPFAYYDAGYGERLTDQSEFLSRVRLSGSGVGLQVSHKNNFVLSVSSALSLDYDTGTNPDPEKMEFLIKLNYLVPH